ncbi:MAG: outer membrane protein assembly factor BamA [Desulfobacteraceae bacterium]|nr:outer membrane protein assembly factor BamA [Desulfobacteraceae bacterium]
MRNGIWITAGIALFFLLCSDAAAETVVKDIKIEGNKRIEQEAVLERIRTEVGGKYDKDLLSKDLEAVFAMGYFDNVRVEVEEDDDGMVVVFVVKENPSLRNIEFSGNRVFEDEELKENINISSGAIINITRIKRDIKTIERMYKEENYHSASADYKIKQVDENRADLEFVIEEGKKTRVKEIIIEGNNAFPDKKLKKIMKTSEKGFFSWLTLSGDLDMQTLGQDVNMLESHYQNHGYAEARVAEPDIRYEGEWIYITIKIHEGPRFKVGEVAFEGELIANEEKLREKISIDDQEYYNRQVLQNDVMSLSDLYADQGYARSDIRPELKKRPEDNVVDIVFHLRKNRPVYFEKIIIEGNTKTRDKVIRRELQVQEQEEYSASKLKRSVRNLYRLDYFKDIDVKTREGSSEDRMILDINVEEKATGSFTFGAGYSAVEKFYVMSSISERNFLGRGQRIELRAQAGSESRQFRFIFTEPWLFDIPLSATLEGYNWERDYSDYERDSKGGLVRFGYPLFDYTRGYISYAYDISGIENVSEDYTHRVSEGRYTESSVTTSIVYDSRDRAINPTEGSKHKLSFEYAGLGGNVGFAKTKAEAGKYFPLFWDTVGFLHAEGGHVTEVGGKYLPDYEKFYLGGINSLRGFDWRDVSVIEEDEEGNLIRLGGEKYVQFNVEFIFPLLKNAGLRGVLFYDTGNVYEGGESVDLGELRQSAGYGIRWYSPLGPLRLERGYILDRKKDKEGNYIEDSGRWEFSIGGVF